MRAMYKSTTRDLMPSKVKLPKATPTSVPPIREDALASLEMLMLMVKLPPTLKHLPTMPLKVTTVLLVRESLALTALPRKEMLDQLLLKLRPLLKARLKLLVDVETETVEEVLTQKRPRLSLPIEVEPINLLVSADPVTLVPLEMVRPTMVVKLPVSKETMKAAKEALDSKELLVEAEVEEAETVVIDVEEMIDLVNLVLKVNSNKNALLVRTEVDPEMALVLREEMPVLEKTTIVHLTPDLPANLVPITDLLEIEVVTRRVVNPDAVDVVAEAPDLTVEVLVLPERTLLMTTDCSSPLTSYRST